MSESNDFGMGYAMGQDSNRNSGGMFGGGDGWWGIILQTLLFGWGNGGFGGGKPMAMLQQAAEKDPRARQALQMIQGKSAAELKQTVENMCKERDTTPEQVARQMGLL